MLVCALFIFIIFFYFFFSQPHPPIRCLNKQAPEISQWTNEEVVR
jgi:hypothetical protein